MFTSTSKPTHLYSINLVDLGAVENLNNWLPNEFEFDECEEQVHIDVNERLQTSTKIQIMYMALMSVILDEGFSKTDKFRRGHRFLSINELQNITLSGQLEKQQPFDSLSGLLNLVYKKLTVIFKYQLSKLTDNFSVFWFFRSVFTAALTLLKMYSREEYHQVHTQSLLTMIMKQQDSTTLIKEFKRLRVGF